MLFVLAELSAEGVLSHPRKVYVITTQHFDILFPKECARTAKLFADNADSLYESAKIQIGSKYDFRIPIVISPDSDTLSIRYTASPYNRFVIMDGIPTSEQFCSDDTKLNLFYGQLCMAMASSIRTPFQQFLADVITGSNYQPVALLNLPFSFIESRSRLVQNDYDALTILVQAKIEDKFPSYYQASVTYDIYPGNDLIIAACTAFSAYLIQAYGYEKYSEIWNESGTIHPFLMAGIFYKIYGKTIQSLWKEFEDSIPLPENLEYMQERNEITQKIFAEDTEGLYSNVLITDYGIVWYDAMRHEVDIYDKNSKSKIRRLLFLADDVEKMTLSPDGRYVAVTYTQIKTGVTFKKKVAWIYDLKEREFLDSQEYCLRDAAIIRRNNENLVAGIALNDEFPKIQVWNFTEDIEDEKPIYERKFSLNELPYSLIYAGDDNLAFLLKVQNNQYLVKLNLSTGYEQRWKLSQNNNIKINELYLCKTESEGIQKNIYAFEFKNTDGFGLSRMGYITLDDDYNPEKIYFQQFDLSGGAYYPQFVNDKVYFVSKKLNHNELCILPVSELNFEEGKILQSKTASLEKGYEPPEIFFDKKNLDEYKLSRYFPLKYLYPFDLSPFLPIKNISIDEGASKWPGLGATIGTHSDPFINNNILVSAGWNFFDMSLTKIFNGSQRIFKEEMLDENAENKSKSFAAFMENTSTPVDIKVGALLKYNFDGEYDFLGIAGTSWQVPVGMNFSNLSFGIQSEYEASTDYYDPDYVGVYKSLNNWPSFEDAYSLFRFSLSAGYGNIHQYGQSPYEKRGIRFGARLYSIWDLYEIKLLEKTRKELLEGTASLNENEKLTEAQVNEFYQENMLNISQLNLGMYVDISIPRLTPLHIKNGWVLSVPAKVSLELFNTTGVALDTKAEILLIGKEIHNGFPFLQLYFSRFGIYAGYDLKLNYDTTKVGRPDLRKRENYGKVLTETTLDDNIFVTINLDLSSPIGFLSSKVIGTVFKISYYPRTNATVLNFNVVANF